MRHRKTSNLATVVSSAIVVLAGVSHSVAIDTTWNIAGSGNWDGAANWDNGVPSATDEAIIDNTVNASAVTVTIGQSLTRDVGGITIVDNGANPHALAISNNTFLDVHGDITNNGLINLASTGNNTLIRADGSDVLLGGNGTLDLGTINSSGLSATGNWRFTNGANHTISGVGNIGQNAALFTNNGLIDANVNGGELAIDPRSGGPNSFENNGTVRASGGGIVELSGNGFGDFGGTGVYLAQTGSEIRIASAAILRSTTLESSGTGFIRTLDGLNTEFHDITNNSDFRVGNNTDARMHGTITNNDSITLASVGFQSDFELGADVTLTGGGSLNMTGPVAQINSIGNFRLTNVNNTIQGRGNLGGNSALITNNGLVDANVPGEILAIDPRSDGPNSFENNGTTQASGGGILELRGNGFGDFGGTGVYRAQNGSEIRIASSAALRTTTLDSIGNGFVRTLDGTNTEFHDITNNSDFRVGNNSDARMHGTIINNASITLASTGLQSDFELGDNVTLRGGGTINMTGGNPQINSIGSFRLTNEDNTIQGKGNVGANSASITNNGLIHANLDGETMTLDPRSVDDAFVNNGTLRASNGGQMVLSQNGFGGFTNTGIIEALNDSSVTTSGNPTIAQITGSTVSAGTYRAIDTGAGATLDIAPTGFQVATNDGVIEARGANAANDVLGTFTAGVHTNNALVQNNGKILLSNSASLTVDSIPNGGMPVVNAGEMLVGSGSTLDVASRTSTFTIPSDTTDAGLYVDGGTLRGSGTIVGGVYMPSGNLSPGDADGQAGLLSIVGDFNMDDPDNLVENARTVIELGGNARGTEYDSFDATGDFFGQGELHATLINGFLPDIGDEFVITTYVEDGNVAGNLWDNYTFNRVQFSLVDRSLGGQNRETVMTVLDIRDIDFDGDDNFNCSDVDALVADIAAGNNTAMFDLDFNGVVNTDDLNIWLNDAGAANLASGSAYLPGDANLDGVVDGQDFIEWNSNRFSSTAAWCSGDFNADGSVDGQDFIVWNDNKFTSSGIITRIASVPEPAAGLLIGFAMCWSGILRRGKR